MLSRVADALYWMSRYVERAEHAARVAEVTRNALIDLAELDPKSADQQWKTALAALAARDVQSMESLVFDESDPASILSALSRARENARQVREVISSEMWEHLNRAYWDLKEAAGSSERDAELSQTLGDVVAASYLWGGVTDGTMHRGEGWLFIKLGQFVERADRSCRLVTAASSAALARAFSGSAQNVPWLALLRGMNALEAFRKVHPTRVEPRQVVEFVVLDREFPRTVRYSVAVASDFASRLAEGSDRTRPVDRAFGKLAAMLDYADADEVVDPHTERFLKRVLVELAEASLTLQRTYFLH